MRKIEQTARIPVVDADGQPAIVDEFTTFTSFEPVNGRQEWSPGSVGYECDGEHCNWLPDGTFRTLLSGRVLRRVTDPS